ncbi:MAG: Gfo/Idh/MocA family oxidoreductase [Burkholderiales bacterium]|nr:Gfo/Idh/MocA family oxidoreductase [Burkholderiales bacterium]
MRAGGKPWRLAFSGYGQLGSGPARLLAAERWCRIVAVADPRRAARRSAQADLGLSASALYTDCDAMLRAAAADVLLVNTPSELHYAQARAALERGLHVLVAKPITNSFRDAMRLVRLARARRLKLAVGQQIRFNRHYRAVQDFVASGALGRIELVHFLNSKPRHRALNLASLDQPALLEMSCHHFDALFAILPRALPETIVADGFRPSWSVYRGPCMVNALIRLSGGVHVLYHGGFSAQADCYELRLEGTRGALRCRGTHMSVDDMRYEFARRGEAFAPVEIDAGAPPVNPWREFFARWRAWLEGRPEPPFSGRNNLEVFALVAAGIESVRSGRQVGVAGSARYRAAFESSR